jgi:hypothetical protein
VHEFSRDGGVLPDPIRGGRSPRCIPALATAFHLRADTIVILMPS